MPCSVDTLPFIPFFFNVRRFGLYIRSHFSHPCRLRLYSVDHRFNLLFLPHARLRTFSVSFSVYRFPLSSRCTIPSVFWFFKCPDLQITRSSALECLPAPPGTLSTLFPPPTYVAAVLGPLPIFLRSGFFFTSALFPIMGPLFPPVPDPPLRPFFWQAPSF